jgi:hypothetical protein
MHIALMHIALRHRALRHTALMYMTVCLVVIDTQGLRAFRKYAFSVIRRSFQFLSHLYSCR